MLLCNMTTTSTIGTSRYNGVINTIYLLLLPIMLILIRILNQKNYIIQTFFHFQESKITYR